MTRMFAVLLKSHLTACWAELFLWHLLPSFWRQGNVLWEPPGFSK